MGGLYTGVEEEAAKKLQDSVFEGRRQEDAPASASESTLSEVFKYMSELVRGKSSLGEPVDELKKKGKSSDDSLEKFEALKREPSDKPIPLDQRLKLSIVGPIVRALSDFAKEFEVKGFNYEVDSKERIESLRKFKSEVDYEKMMGRSKRVAIFGETHPVVESRNELISHMKEYKKLGFTHVALEALPSTRQKLVDDYIAGKAERKSVLAAIQKDWGWAPESYMKLIDSAKDNGLKVLCLDKKIPREQEKKWEKEGKYTESMHVREENWTKVIDTTLDGDPKARVLALVGKAHTGIDSERGRLFTSQLKEAGHRPVVIDLSGGDDVGGDTNFETSVDDAKLQGERFMIPVYGKGTFRPSDFIVHMKETSGNEWKKFPFLEEPRFKREDIPRQFRIEDLLDPKLPELPPIPGISPSRPPLPSNPRK